MPSDGVQPVVTIIRMIEVSGPTSSLATLVRGRRRPSTMLPMPATLLLASIL